MNRLDNSSLRVCLRFLNLQLASAKKYNQLIYAQGNILTLKRSLLSISAETSALILVGTTSQRSVFSAAVRLSLNKSDSEAVGFWTAMVASTWHAILSVQRGLKMLGKILNQLCKDQKVTKQNGYTAVQILSTYMLCKPVLSVNTKSCSSRLGKP